LPFFKRSFLYFKSTNTIQIQNDELKNTTNKKGYTFILQLNYIHWWLKTEMIKIKIPSSEELIWITLFLYN